MDREKVIKGLECCIEWDSCNKCPYETPNEYDISECTLTLHRDALALLKEQEAIVRCKDCKHKPKEIPFTTWGGHDTYFEFPEGSRCPCQCSDDQYYSWNPDADWFCADGERKEGR